MESSLRHYYLSFSFLDGLSVQYGNSFMVLDGAPVINPSGRSRQIVYYDEKENKFQTYKNVMGHLGSKSGYKMQATLVPPDWPGAVCQ